MPDEMAKLAAELCPLIFTPSGDDPPCPQCSCDLPLGHGGKHHCPECGAHYSMASESTGTPTSVGDTRAFLASTYGIPHTDETHYVIVADSEAGPFICTCCDGTDEAARMCRGALMILTGNGPEFTETSGKVLVNGDALRTVLSRFTGAPLFAEWTPEEHKALRLVREAAERKGS